MQKKGDVKNVGNYRPICSLPELYKLFTTILYSRLYPRLDQKQAEDQAGFRSSYQTTDHLCDVQNDWAEMPRGGNQNVDSDNWLHAGFRLHYTQINLESTQFLRYRNTTTSASRRRFSETRYWLTKKATCSRSRKEPNRVIFCQACFSTCFCRKHWKTTFRAGTRKKVWEFTLVTMTMIASQTWDLPTTCSCLHPPKKSFKKCCANSRKLLKKWDSGFVQKRRKFLATKARTPKKQEMEVDNIVEILTRGQSVRYLGQMITFLQQETTEIRNRIRAAWATFHK